MQTQFSGTTFLNPNIVRTGDVGKMVYNRGFINLKVGSKNTPLIVRTDEKRNADAKHIDADLKKLAETAAKKAHVTLNKAYHYSKKPTLSTHYENRLARQFMTNA